MREFWKNREKGAVIVMFALFIPLLMLCAGLAIDLGNLYAHKTRLQNAADAAALAGAREFAVEGETVDSHPKANDEAELYVDKNAQKNNLTNQIETKCKAIDDSANSAIYFAVRLKETVPLYFLRIVGLTEQEVSAYSVAAITTSAGGEDLFIFSDKFSIVNSISNPDNFDTDGQILTTFDSAISYTSRSNPNDSNYKYSYLGYSDQTDKLQSFFTSKARGMSVNAAREKDSVTQEKLDEGVSIRYDKDKYVHTAQPVSYDMDDIFRQTVAKLGISEEFPTAPEKPNIQQPWLELWKAGGDKEKEAQIQAKYDADKAVYDEAMSKYDAEYAAYEAALAKYSRERETYYSTDLSNDIAIATGSNSARTLNIDGSLGSATDKPIYVYIDENCSPVHINITANNERPVVLCYTGTSQLDFNMSSGVTFRGILYVPNSPDTQSLLIHDSNGSKFEGSIIANSLTLHGAGATYEYVNFGVTDSGYKGGGNGSSKVGPSSTVKLVKYEGLGEISWN